MTATTATTTAGARAQRKQKALYWIATALFLLPMGTVILALALGSYGLWSRARPAARASGLEHRPTPAGSEGIATGAPARVLVTRWLARRSRGPVDQSCT